MFGDAPLARGLTVYGLRDFPGELSGRGIAAVGDMEGTGETTDMHLHYSGHKGERVIVASSIGGDREAMRYFVLSNMALMLPNDDPGFRVTDPRAVLLLRLEEGVFAWEGRSVAVAGEPVAFEVLEIGRRWAAVGESAGTQVGLYASDYPIERVHLAPSAS